MTDLKSNNTSESITVIEPEPGWRFINFREIWEYKDLLYFLVQRDIKSLYAQSVLGFGWAIIQPLLSMIVFTLYSANLQKSDLTVSPMLSSVLPDLSPGPTFQIHLE